MNTKWYRDMSTALRNERFAMVREHAQAGCLECMGKQLKEMMAHIRLVTALVEFTRSMAETVASFTQAVNDVKSLPPTFKQGGIMGERAGLLTKEFVLDPKRARFDWNTMTFGHQPVYVPPQEPESGKGAPRAWPTPHYYTREQIAALCKAKTPEEYMAVQASIHCRPNLANGGLMAEARRQIAAGEEPHLDSPTREEVITNHLRERMGRMDEQLRDRTRRYVHSGGRQFGRGAAMRRWMQEQAVIISDPGDEQPTKKAPMHTAIPHPFPLLEVTTYHLTEQQ